MLTNEQCSHTILPHTRSQLVMGVPNLVPRAPRSFNRMKNGEPINITHVLVLYMPGSSLSCVVEELVESGDEAKVYLLQ